MPRLPPRLFRHAHRLDPLLPVLLPECRSIESARAELRWLREHAAHVRPADSHALLAQYCRLRGRHSKPLQYILGTQPFGPLEIVCLPGVLIPRPETEWLLEHLLSLLPPRRKRWKIVDLCTGTGVIPLYLAANIDCDVIGIDISAKALALARQNMARNQGKLQTESKVAFMMGDILHHRDYVVHTVQKFLGEEVDIVISNPPYISTRGFDRETSRSVRKWEPRLALVPPGQGGISGDAFYPAISDIANQLSARAMLVEVGGWEQVERIRKGWNDEKWAGTAAWADWCGRGRGVTAWTKGYEWIGSGPDFDRM